MENIIKGILICVGLCLLLLVSKALGANVSGDIELSDFLMIIASSAAAVAASLSYFLSREAEKANKLRDSCFLLVRKDINPDILKYQLTVINQGPNICFIKGVYIADENKLISIESPEYEQFLADIGFSSSLNIMMATMSLPIVLRPGAELILVTTIPNWKEIEFVKNYRSNHVAEAINSLVFHIEYEDIHKTQKTWPDKSA